MIKLTGLYKKKDKNNKKYLIGELSSFANILIFVNKNKKEKNHPDCNLYITNVTNNRQEKNEKHKIRIFGLYYKKDINQKFYMIGKIGQATILIFENKDKTKKNSPDFYIYIAIYKNNNQNIKDNNFNNDEF